MNRTPNALLSNEQGTFRAVEVIYNSTVEGEEIKAEGVFIFIGSIPNTRFLAKNTQLTEQGFIGTKPGSVETSLLGIMAAGGCREGAITEVATATGEGVLTRFAIKAFLTRQTV